MIDIHSHILPNIDDGSKSIEESVNLLNILKEQGITEVIATPHFYPHLDNLEEFSEHRQSQFEELSEAIKDKNLPKIYLGCEILYFNGIANVNNFDSLTLNGSKYLLMELTDDCINDDLFYNLSRLRNEKQIIPIIAHLERYHRSKNFKKLLKFIKKEKIVVQLNADSFLEGYYASILKKLINSDLELIVASDTHSSEHRPPFISKALSIIKEKYGETCYDKILKNMSILSNNIIGGI